MTIENPQYYYDKSKGYNAEADSQYNAYKLAQANVAELAGMNNPNRISGEIQKIRDYNKPLLDQQAEIVEKQNQIASKYRGPSNLLWSQQEQLMNQELGSNRKEAQALGAYMVARSGSLADIVNSWQNAFNARFGATKETAELARNAWDMAFKQQDSSYDKGFGIEKQQTADKQWAAEYAQKDRLAAAARNSGGGKETPSLSDYVKKFVQYDNLPWEETAKQLTALGFDVSGGSVADRLLRETYMGKSNIGTFKDGQWK